MTESHSAGPNHAAAPLSIVVLASGTGSLLQSMLDTLDAARVRVAAVGSDKDCEALKRAEAAGIPSFQVPFDAAARADRAGWDAKLLAAEDLAAAAGVAIGSQPPAASPAQFPEDEIAAALTAEQGNVVAAARRLGLNRNKIRRWLERHGVDARAFKDR